ncbi:uncharacterized protein METZ01_LOCUS270532, partial [marine metagenome]
MIPLAVVLAVLVSIVVLAIGYGGKEVFTILVKSFWLLAILSVV